MDSSFPGTLSTESILLLYSQVSSMQMLTQCFVKAWGRRMLLCTVCLQWERIKPAHYRHTAGSGMVWGLFFHNFTWRSLADDSNQADNEM